MRGIPITRRGRRPRVEEQEDMPRVISPLAQAIREAHTSVRRITFPYLMSAQSPREQIEATHAAIDAIVTEAAKVAASDAGCEGPREALSSYERGRLAASAEILAALKEAQGE
jgi:hypothetical protein